MIGLQAGALLVGNAEQRSALNEFLRDKSSSILVASSAAPLESLRVLLEGGAVLFDFLECEREESQWCRRFKVGVLDADVGSRALARVQNTTAMHIKDLSLGKLEHAATPGTALGVDGAVRAQRCVESDACRAELASRCCQQLLAVCWPASATDAPTRAATCCSTLLAMPLPEELSTTWRLSIRRIRRRAACCTTASR
jgi:hypothetical protein